LYDSDKVRNDINLLSWYLRHPTWKNDKKSHDPVKEGKYCLCCYITLEDDTCIYHSSISVIDVAPNNYHSLKVAYLRTRVFGFFF